MSDMESFQALLLIVSEAARMLLIVVGLFILFVKCPKSETQMDRIESYVHAYAFLILVMGCI